MSTRDLAQDEFLSTVTRDGLVLIDWWAPWCQPCKTFAPIYDRVSADHPDVVFGKIDTEKEADLAAELGIRSVPTLMVFRDGILLFAQAGAIPERALRKLVDEASRIDMDEVRRSMADAERDEELEDESDDELQ
jgi:thioredoxin 1